jgi:hypothetical protein
MGNHSNERGKTMKEPSEKALKTWVLALTSVASLMVALDALVVTTASAQSVSTSAPRSKRCSGR